MQQINGKIAFEGIAIGKIKEVFKENNVVRRVKINDVQAEIERFEAARDQAAQELKELYDSLNLAMTFKDFQHIQHYFKEEEKRDPSMTEIRVLDEELAEALKQLPEQSRNIVLMFFFLDMSDSEIGEKLNINRSTSYRHRRNSLEEIRKQLKEKKTNEE